jgi:predicted translin family RNA/ssDNA-binding protein
MSDLSIFALQRYASTFITNPLYPSISTNTQSVRTLASPITPSILKSLTQYQNTIRTNFTALTPDLQSIDSYRYHRQVSPGIQEWMESLLFHHYLATQTLMTFEDACMELRTLCAGPAPTSNVKEQANVEAEPAVTKKVKLDGTEETIEPPTPIELTPTDYILGLFDLTGELMRFSITSIATSGSLPTSTSSSDTTGDNHISTVSATPRTPLTDLQSLRQTLSTLDYGDGPFARDSEKKLEVTVQSVEKVEKAMYGLVVRGSERPRGWVPEMDSGAGGRQEVESY